MKKTQDYLEQFRYWKENFAFKMEYGNGFFAACARNYKKILIIGIALIVVTTGFYLTKRDKSFVEVCESSIDYNKGIGLTFYVGADGKSVTKIEKNDTVSLDFIKKNITKDVTEDESQKILNEYKKNVKFLYESTSEKYKDIKWFGAKINEEEDKIKTTYIFNVSSPNFDFEKYKSLLEEFSLEYYYNKDEKKFIYDEETILSEKTPLGNIKNIECHEIEK